MTAIRQRGSKHDIPQSAHVIQDYCGCPTFTQKVSVKSELVYEVEFGDDIRKDCLDRDDETLEAKPYQCKKCRTPLVDERDVPLFEASEIKTWATRNKKELLAAKKRYDQEQ